MGLAASNAWAQYKVVPWTFVGTEDNCGIAGNKIVTSSWLNGMGLPDNGTAHPDGTKHQGLLLSKNGPTANCSSAGADIGGFSPGGTLSGLGFDFRRGSHCGAGAPRFNVYTNPNFTEYYFFGCSSGVHTDSSQDPAQWERVRFSGADGQPNNPLLPPFVFGVTQVYAIEIVFDEGTDAPVAGPPGRSDIEGVGLAVLDNILINNTVIRKKGETPITP